MPSFRRVLPILQPLFIVFAFVFLGLLLRNQWHSLATYEWRLRPGWLLLAAGFLIGGALIEIRMWQRLIQLFGGQLRYPSAVRIWFASAIMRYVPGNIWQPLRLTLLCREKGVRAEATLAGLTLFQVIHVLAVGVIAGLYLATWGRDGALPHYLGSFSRWWAVLVPLPVAFFLARPHSMIVFANFMLAKIGREPLPVDLSSGQLFRMMGISLTAWSFFCAAFTSVAAAVMPPIGPAFGAAIPHLAAAYPIAFAIGFLSVLTPSGLVVREGMIFLLIAPIVGPENALVVALGMRVWELTVDATMAAIAMSIPYLRRSRTSLP